MAIYASVAVVDFLYVRKLLLLLYNIVMLTLFEHHIEMEKETDFVSIIFVIVFFLLFEFKSFFNDFTRARLRIFFIARLTLANRRKILR